MRNPDTYRATRRNHIRRMRTAMATIVALDDIALRVEAPDCADWLLEVAEVLQLRMRDRRTECQQALFDLATYGSATLVLQ